MFMLSTFLGENIISKYCITSSIGKKKLRENADSFCELRKLKLKMIDYNAPFVSGFSSWK